MSHNARIRHEGWRKMPAVTLPRSFRPRLLLLPLVLGALLLPALRTTTPAAEHEMRAGAVCSNLEPEQRREPVKTPDGPNCASCRAPLLNAPLAHVERDADIAAGDAPPAA
jgi:hypothetical protein